VVTLLAVRLIPKGPETGRTVEKLNSFGSRGKKKKKKRRFRSIKKGLCLVGGTRLIQKRSSRQRIKRLGNNRGHRPLVAAGIAGWVG